MTIRLATVADQQTVLELLQKFYLEERIDLPRQILSDRLTRFLTVPHGVVFLASFDSQSPPCGFALVSTSFGVEFGAHAELEDLFVVPAARGQGVATTLLAEIREWCRQAARDSLSLVVTPEDEAERHLIAFYEKRGFVNFRRLILFDPSTRQGTEPL